MTDAPVFTRRFVNLASPKMGTEAVACTDDFFAPMHRMLQDCPAVWKEGEYDENGKWMDGWESRRKRVPGHDRCLVRLGVPGVIHGIDIDTAWFTGNYPPEALLEGCLSATRPDDPADWIELVPRHDLKGNSHNYRQAESGQTVNWVRLHIYPDGGVARLRLYGEPVVDWAALGDEEVIELSALKNGGRIVGYNDAHYGDVSALLSEGRGAFMGDGWETRRRREPGNDWIVIRLGHAGLIERLEIDTAHFKGNYPDRASVQAALVEGGDDAALLEAAEGWEVLLDQQKLQSDAVHRFAQDRLVSHGPANAVRLNIYPDGGVSRFRVYGKLAR